MDAERPVLVVEDDGPGIPPEFLPAATERFTRASTAHEGAGLGLAIVQRIADRGSGQFRLSDVDPHGLRVALAIPAVGAREPGSGDGSGT